MLSIIILSGCTDSIIQENNIIQDIKETKLTTISIDKASAGAKLPQLSQKTGATRAAVVMDDMFKLTEDNDFQTDAYTQFTKK